MRLLHRFSLTCVRTEDSAPTDASKLDHRKSSRAPPHHGALQFNHSQIKASITKIIIAFSATMQVTTARNNRLVATVARCTRDRWCTMKLQQMPCIASYYCHATCGTLCRWHRIGSSKLCSGSLLFVSFFIFQFFLCTASSARRCFCGVAPSTFAMLHHCSTPTSHLL